MGKDREQVDEVSEISVDPQPSGLRAVYLVETRTSEQEQEVGQLFADLESQIEVRQLCGGKLISFAVQALESDSTVLDEIEAILKTNYPFVVTQRSFDEVIYQIVRELAEDTNSELMPPPVCNICRKTEPFPTILVSLSDEDGTVLLSRSYCASCTAEAQATNNKDFVRSLLAADEQDFGGLEAAELIRHPSRKKPIRFKIRL